MQRSMFPPSATPPASLQWQKTLWRSIDFLSHWRGGLWIILAASLFALGFALIAQYGFGYQPCVLCLWQRVPYMLCLAITIIALSQRKLSPWHGALLLLCSVILLFPSAGLAAFHIGVERHWWEGTAGCAIQGAGAQDAAALRHKLLQQPVARCDEISWTLFGLSMTVWNLFYTLTCGLLAAFIVFFGKPHSAPAPRKPHAQT